VQAILDETVRRAGPTPIFLRVVSRVYLAGGVIVSLQRAGSAGAQARGGFNPPEVPSLIGEDGQVNAGYTNLLKVLSETAKSPIADIVDKTKAGGTVRFVAASSSSVGLAESFDRLLAVGYLGFDVPVYAGGVLGAPLPTFQLLSRSVSAPAATHVGGLTEEQTRVQINLAALGALTASDPRAGLSVMAGTVRRLSDKRFAELAQQCESALAGSPDQMPDQGRATLKQFGPLVNQYVSVGGGTGLNYRRFDAAFTRAYDERDKD